MAAVRYVALNPARRRWFRGPSMGLVERGGAMTAGLPLRQAKAIRRERRKGGGAFRVPEMPE